MNKNEKPAFSRRKGAAVSLVICFAAVIALAGAYTFSNYQKKLDEQLAQAEEQAKELTEDNQMEERADETDSVSEETAADEIMLPKTEQNAAEETETPDETDGADQDMDAGSTESEVSETDGNTSGLWFSEDSTLAWPASGALIMGYSMDQTVFFQTLEQYRYNPAMIISGETGEEICASAAGMVSGIENTAETGTTVTLDMGNGYSAVYGQLTDVPVSDGDYVAAGEKIGNLAEPTKYYSVEGPNLYFEVLKDGEPVDPMNFME